MNETNKPQGAKNKTLMMIAFLVIVVLLVVVIAMSLTRESAPTINPIESSPVSQENQIGLAPVGNGEDFLAEEMVIPEALEGAIALAPGTSLVSERNVVLNSLGEPVKMNIDPASSEAPQESRNLSPSEIPNDAYTVRLGVSSAGFEPNTFTVKSGQLVNLVLTSNDSFAHIIKFEDENLLGALLGVAGGETKMKSWNAPLEKGEYLFFCSIPGHQRRGEVGMMIVE